jgi:hypothetical protein
MLLSPWIGRAAKAYFRPSHAFAPGPEPYLSFGCKICEAPLADANQRVFGPRVVSIKMRETMVLEGRGKPLTSLRFLSTNNNKQLFAYQTNNPT